jgi:pimeloyl-ACP methyl ester carboxylesterase
MKWLAALCLGLVALACRGPRAERPGAACTHVQAVREVRGTALCEDAWTCDRPPGGRFDRIGLHRLAPCEDTAGPVLLYLPGMHMTGEIPGTDPRVDLRLHLALAGVRTWGLDWRSHAVPPETATEDLARLESWTTDVFTDDAAWAAGFVRAADRGPLYVAGFSYGAALAYRLAGRPHEPLAGLVVLDGVLGSGGSRSSGSSPGVAIDVGGGRLAWTDRRRLLTAVVANPSSASPLPGYPSAGEALADVLFTAPSFGGRGGLANTRAGVSDIVVLAQLLASYDRWWPRAASEVGGAAQPARPLPVLAFASTRLGSEWVEHVRDSARTYGGPATTVHELREYGHLDVLVSRSAPREVYAPILAWLTRTSGTR